jgi:hypothetical protein
MRINVKCLQLKHLGDTPAKLSIGGFNHVKVRPGSVYPLVLRKLCLKLKHLGDALAKLSIGGFNHVKVRPGGVYSLVLQEALDLLNGAAALA